MKRLLHGLRTTIAGGVLFLLPFAVLLLLLGKAHQMTRTLIAPLAERLPIPSLLGFETPRILAALLLVAICFAAGLLARTAAAKRLVYWLESALLSNLPSYSFMKNIGEEYAAGTPGAGQESVLVRLDDAYQFGFLMERLADGFVVVFVPGAPKPWSGDVLIVEQGRVTLLSPSSKVALKCLQRLGAGSGALVNGRLSPGDAAE